MPDVEPTRREAAGAPAPPNEIREMGRLNMTQSRTRSDPVPNSLVDLPGLLARNLNAQIPARVRPVMEPGERALVIIRGVPGAIVATDRRVIVERTATPLRPEIFAYKALSRAVGHLEFWSRRSVALVGPTATGDPGMVTVGLSRNATSVPVWRLARARQSVAELNALIPALSSSLSGPVRPETTAPDVRGGSQTDRLNPHRPPAGSPDWETATAGQGFGRAPETAKASTASPVKGLAGGVAIGCVGPLLVGVPGAVVLGIALQAAGSNALQSPSLLTVIVLVSLAGLFALGAFARARLGGAASVLGLTVGLLAWSWVGYANGSGPGAGEAVVGLLMFPGLGLAGWFAWPPLKALVARRSGRTWR